VSGEAWPTPGDQEGVGRRDRPVGAGGLSRHARIQEHIGVVHRAVRRVTGCLPPHVDEAEVVGYGILGLLDALDRHGDLSGAEFEAVAAECVWQRILEALRDMDWLATEARGRVRELQLAYDTVERMLGRPATEDEVAARLEVTREKLCEWLEEASRTFVACLDQLVWVETAQGDRYAAPLSEPATSDLGPEQREELERLLAEAISKLPQEDRLVVTLYYYEELSFREISEVLDISEKRAAQIHGRAGLRLRANLAQAAQAAAA